MQIWRWVPSALALSFLVHFLGLLFLLFRVRKGRGASVIFWSDKRGIISYFCYVGMLEEVREGEEGENRVRWKRKKRN